MQTEAREYEMTVRFQCPSWDETGGISYTTVAASKSDAIRTVRRRAENDGHLPSAGRGRVTLTAEPA